MPLTLYVDGPRWRDHLTNVAQAHPLLVPVAKGNGYGFGVGTLARRAAWLGSDTVAVGSYGEVDEVARRFDADIVVLEPWRPYAHASTSDRVIHTIGRSADLAALVAAHEGSASPRVVLEGLTSMRRHGFADPDELMAAARARGVRVEGGALHLPLGFGHTPEVERWLAATDLATWWVSHLTDEEVRDLSSRHASTHFRPRIGTALWLGDREALSPRATVVDVHRVTKGDRVGYRQRLIRRDGHLLVVSGGTAHGIALEAPSVSTTARQRATSVAKGGLEAAGRALSPFVVAGKQRWFAEPPHMQVSMVFLPSDVRAPAVGDEVDVQVRLTTTTFDHVHIS